MSKQSKTPEPEAAEEVAEIEDANPEVSAAEETTAGEDYKAKWQRSLADLENLRKRSEHERSSLMRYALEGFLQDLLPVVDNFYRATEHVPQDQQNSAWVTGIQYIQKNLLDVLAAQGVSEITIKPGDAFNPQLHEAIGSVESQTEDETVAEVKTRGYMLQDRVLRPAQVTVHNKSS